MLKTKEEILPIKGFFSMHMNGKEYKVYVDYVVKTRNPHTYNLVGSVDDCNIEISLYKPKIEKDKLTFKKVNYVFFKNPDEKYFTLYDMPYIKIDNVRLKV